MSSDLVIVGEGGLKILVPRRPGQTMTSRTPGFYNPAMVTNRDIATICAAAYSKAQPRPIVACDIMSATGIRGLRYLGLDDVLEVHMNDIGRTAFELMYRNLEMNYSVKDVTREESAVRCLVDGKTVLITNQEALLFLAQHKHHYQLLDLDPFGSPVGFIPSCLKALRHGSLLCITATDTAPLCGTYPRTCLRRYGCLSMKTDYMHELGVRILVAHVARQACSLELGVKPLLCHATAHYYRVYLEVKGSRKASDRSLDMIGWGGHCKRCGSRQAFAGHLPAAPSCCGEPMSILGPLWAGPLKDDEFLSGVMALCPFPGVGDEAAGILRKLAEELDTYSYYDLHHLSRRLGIPAPSTSRVLHELHSRGFQASPTHISGRSVKTDASLADLVGCLTRLS